MLIADSVMLMLQSSLKTLLSSLRLFLHFAQHLVAYRGIPKLASIMKYPATEPVKAVIPIAAGLRTLVTYITVRKENRNVIALIKKLIDMFSAMECFILP